MCMYLVLSNGYWPEHWELVESWWQGFAGQISFISKFKSIYGDHLIWLYILNGHTKMIWNESLGSVSVCVARDKMVNNGGGACIWSVCCVCSGSPQVRGIVSCWLQHTKPKQKCLSKNYSLDLWWFIVSILGWVLWLNGALQTIIPLSTSAQLRSIIQVQNWNHLLWDNRL